MIEYDSSKIMTTHHRFYALRDWHPFSLENLQQHLYSLVPMHLCTQGRKDTIDNTTSIYLPTMGDIKNIKTVTLESGDSDKAQIEERKTKKAEQSYGRGRTMINLIEERANNSEQVIIHDCDRK